MGQGPLGIYPKNPSPAWESKNSDGSSGLSPVEVARSHLFTFVPQKEVPKKPKEVGFGFLGWLRLRWISLDPAEVHTQYPVFLVDFIYFHHKKPQTLQLQVTYQLKILSTAVCFARH